MSKTCSADTGKLADWKDDIKFFGFFFVCSLDAHPMMHFKSCNADTYDDTVAKNLLQCIPALWCKLLSNIQKAW